MRTIKKLFITVSFLILSTVQAQTIVTEPGTDWDTGNIPSANDDVLIASGQTAIMTNKGTQTTPYQVASIFGSSGSQLELHQSVVEATGIVLPDFNEFNLIFLVLILLCIGQIKYSTLN